MMGCDFNTLPQMTQHQMAFKFMTDCPRYTTGDLAACLRGFGAMRLQVTRDINQDIHKYLVRSLIKVMTDSTSGREIAEAIFGFVDLYLLITVLTYMCALCRFGSIEYHRLHLLPMSVINSVEQALKNHLPSMNNASLVNSLMGLAAMGAESRKLSPELVDLLQTTLSDRLTLNEEQRYEAEQA